MKRWLWRAIDASGDTLDIFATNTKKCQSSAAFFGKLIAPFGQPLVAIIDKIRSYIKIEPIRQLSPITDHRVHKGLNNTVEVSHGPTRKREKIFGRFKSIRHEQRFLSTHDSINMIFRPRRYQLTSISYRHAQNDAFGLWDDYTAEAAT